MSNVKVVDVNIYTIDTIPQRLAAIAKEQEADLGTGLIFVTTMCCPPSYKFEPVGSKPEDFLAYLHKVSREEGVDLNLAAKRAFGDSQSSENAPVELRVIPHDEAKKLIEDYITDNRGVWTSDIAFNLGLDVGLVLGILRELTQEGAIHSTEITEEP